MARHGLTMSADETESVYKLAAWMSDGLAALQDGAEVNGTDVADAALDLSLFEQGDRLRDGRG